MDAVLRREPSKVVHDHSARSTALHPVIARDMHVQLSSTLTHASQVERAMRADATRTAGLFVVTAIVGKTHATSNTPTSRITCMEASHKAWRGHIMTAFDHAVCRRPLLSRTIVASCRSGAWHEASVPLVIFDVSGISNQFGCKRSVVRRFGMQSRSFLRAAL
jgi:hypothetical protein